MLNSFCAIWIWRLAILLVTIPISISTGSEAEEARLLVTTLSNIYVMDLKTPEIERIAENLNGIREIDYDLARGLIIWNEFLSGKIQSMNMAGADKKIILEKDIGRADGLSVDWIYGNIYWTDSDRHTISVASLDGRLRKVLFDRDLDFLPSIVVNPLEGWMFWSDRGNGFPKIERSGMDGTRRSIIVSEGITDVSGLSIDTDARKIYMADFGERNIKCADYDGSNVKVITSSSYKLELPSGLDVFEDSVYWSDFHLDSIYKADKVTGGNQHIVATGFRQSPDSIRVIHRSKQPKGTNYCQESGVCSHWCLPAPLLCDRRPDKKNFTCVCPNGMVLMDNRKICTGENLLPATETSFFDTETIDCQTESSHATTSLSNENFRSKEEDSEGIGIAGTVIGIVLALAILVSAVGFYIYKQRRRRNCTTENPVC